MPYITQVPGAFLTVDSVSLLNVVTIPTTSVLNDLEGSQEFDTYEVRDDENGAGTLAQGDYVAPVVDGDPLSGTYIGAGQISNLGLSVGSMTDSGLGGILATGISVTVNPIEGSYISGDDGQIYFISEEPLSADRIMASLSVNLPLSGNLITVTVPVSELTASLGQLDPTGALSALLTPVLGSTLDLTQYVMDTAVLSSTTDPTAVETLQSGDFTVEPVCYLKGTWIMTQNGEVKIEDLREGDMVLCRFGGVKPVKWIGRQKFSGPTASLGLPVRIKEGALADGIPSADLFVSEGHSMLVNGVLVLAKNLVNGLSAIRVEDGSEWEYYQIDLGVHDLVLANRSWSESFADCGDFRARFDNYREYLMRFGDEAGPETPDLCLDRPSSGPEFYDAISSVVKRAMSLSGYRKHGPLEGRIESVSRNNVISGWAVDTEFPGLPICLEVVLDGKVVCETIACIPQAGPKTQGRLTFEAHCPSEMTSHELLRATVRRKEDGQCVASLPSAVIGAMHGAIDLVRQDGRVEGWARDKSFPEEPIMLEVTIGDEVLGTVLACRSRTDLANVGFGDVAFLFDANRPFEAHEADMLAIRRLRDGSTIRVSDRTRRIFDDCFLGPAVGAA